MNAAAVESTRVVRRLRRSDLPELLRQIHDPPRALFLRGAGDVEELGRPAVAIVGARACSPYGAQVARMLGRELAAAGLVVVSGLARGIDGEAHRGALDADGLTVAVLGCGIDRDYPAAHAELARRICKRGLVVSEYEPGVEPAPWRFPARKAKGRMGKPFSLNHAPVGVPYVAECRARVALVWPDDGRRLLGHRARSSCAARPLHFSPP
jgi:DNA protecting protein DprA